MNTVPEPRPVEPGKELKALLTELAGLLKTHPPTSAPVQDFLKRHEERQDFQELAAMLLVAEAEPVPAPAAKRGRDTLLTRTLIAAVVLLLVLTGGAFYAVYATLAWDEARQAKAAAETKAAKDKQKAAEEKLRALTEVALFTADVGKKLDESAQPGVASAGQFTIAFTAEQKDRFLQQLARLLKPFADYFLKLLRRQNAKELEAATFALTRISLDKEQQAEAIPLLIQAFGADDNTIRRNASVALGKIGQPAVEPVAALWNNMGGKHQAEAVETLGRIGATPGALDQRYIARIAREVEQKTDLRVSAAFALSRINGDDLRASDFVTAAGQPLVDFLAAVVEDTNQDRSVRSYCITALGQVGQGKTQVVELLIRLLDDNDANFPDLAADALVKVGPDAAAALLKKLDERRQQSGVPPPARLLTALGNLGAATQAGDRTRVNIRNALLDVLQNTGRLSWHAYAAFALGKMKADDEVVVGALADKLAHGSDLTRENAVAALGEIGWPALAPALPQLVNAFTSDANSRVRDRANAVLTRLAEGSEDATLEIHDSAADALSRDSKQDKGFFFKDYKVQLEKDRLYRFDLITKQFDAYLKVLDETGNIVARDDDSGGDLNARVFFIAPRSGSYSVRAMSFRPGAVGRFRLEIRTFPK
jgi:HEAT repeat protein